MPKKFHNHYSPYVSRLLRNVNSILSQKVQTSLSLLQSSENEISHGTRTENTEEFQAIVEALNIPTGALFQDLNKGQNSVIDHS